MVTLKILVLLSIVVGAVESHRKLHSLAGEILAYSPRFLNPILQSE